MSLWDQGPGVLARVCPLRCEGSTYTVRTCGRYKVGKSGATVLAQALLVNTTLQELRWAAFCTVAPLQC